MFAIVVTLLSLCRCAGSFKQFLGVIVQKAYCKFSTYLWAFSKGTGQPDAHMRSLARVFAQHCKYFKRVCETVLVFGVPEQTVKDLQRLLRCLFSIENVTHDQWAILWDISTVFMCIQYWLKPTCASVQSCMNTYCLHTVYLSHVHIHVPILTCRCNYPAGFSSKFWCLNVVCACIECACGMRWWSNSFESSLFTHQ